MVEELLKVVSEQSQYKFGHDYELFSVMQCNFIVLDLSCLWDFDIQVAKMLEFQLVHDIMFQLPMISTRQIFVIEK